MSARRRKFTTGFKVEVAHRVIDSGRSVAEVARELNVGEQSLGSWIRDERRRIKAAKGTEFVVTPVMVDSQAAVLICAASARASAGVCSPSEACGRSLL